MSIITAPGIEPCPRLTVAPDGWFRSQDRCDDLDFIAWSWRGTPFRGWCAVKQRGADCVRLEAAILAELGAIEPVSETSIPHYPLDWASHHDEPILENWLRNEAPFRHRLRWLPAEELAPGDGLLIRVGRVAHHFGLALSRGRMIHTRRGPGAEVVDLDTRLGSLPDTIFSRVVHVVRLAHEEEVRP